MKRSDHSGTWNWVLLSIPVLLLVQWLFLQLGSLVAEKWLHDSNGLIGTHQNFSIVAVLAAAANIITALVFNQLIPANEVPNLGWRLPKKSWILLGMLVAIFVLFATAGLLMVLLQMNWETNNTSIDTLLIQAFFILLLAIGEEFFFRGFLQRHLQLMLHKWPALFISAGIFTLLHAGNPMHTWLTMPGIFVGGLLLGINYLFTGNLWFGIALHFTWNFVQGPILGVAVSGLSFQSLLKPIYTGSYWLTGGNFGFEASIITILFNSLMVWLLAKHFASGVFTIQKAKD